jgi:hypothetical protein
MVAGCRTRTSLGCGRSEGGERANTAGNCKFSNYHQLGEGVDRGGRRQESWAALDRGDSMARGEEREAGGLATRGESPRP